MKGLAGIMLAGLCASVLGEERSESAEFIGKVGTRAAYLVLHATQRAEGGWQVAGEYVILPTLVRRFVEGERSPGLGVTALKEGTTPILFGRPPTGELRGTWRDGAFQGTRFGPGGQKREAFEFSEDFPAMDGYTARVRCAAAAERYASTLSLAVEQGVLKRVEWRSRVTPPGHVCALLGGVQQPMRGGLRFAAGSCAVTLRDVGEFVMLAADGCATQCGSQAYLEPLLIDRRGNCRLLRQEAGAR